MKSQIPVVFPLVGAGFFLLIAMYVETLALRFMSFWFPKTLYRPGVLVKGYKWLLIGGACFLVLGALIAWIRN
jgi:hypothetical protein